MTPSARAWLHRWLLLVVLSVGSGCGDEGATTTTAVQVDTSVALAEVDPRFLSVAIDSGHVAGGALWCPDGSPCDTEPYDFGRARLRALVRELTPGLVRVGGTHADTAFVDVSPDPVQDPPPDYRWVLTAARWDAIHDFVNATGLELMFNLNAGPGPRDAEANWLPDQARLLMERSVAQGQPVSVWELGNEPDGYIANFGLDFAQLNTPERHAAAFQTLQSLRDEVDPDARIAGPAGAWWPEVGEFGSEIFPGFMEAGGGEASDAITWHYYPQQSERCPIASRPAAVDTLLDPSHLGEIDIWAAEVEAEVAEHTSGRPVWLGETGNAQCGGQPGISDRFVGTLWWVEQLGRMARRGQPVVIRQTLSGGAYGLLDDDTLEPRPDYWASVLWQRLMGTVVLEASADVNSLLMAYAQCTPAGAPGYGAGAVTLALIHLGTEEAVEADLTAVGTELSVWRLSGQELTSPEMRLNDARLTLDAEGNLPPLQPEAAGGRVRLEPASLAFAVVSDAAAAPCMP